MDEEAGVSELGDLPCQQLDSLCTVAEDDCLRYVKFGEKSVQAVEFLFLIKVGVKLSETLEREFVGQSYKFGFWHIFLLKVADLDWVGCAEHEDLLLGLHYVNNLLHDVSEVV